MTEREQWEYHTARCQTDPTLRKEGRSEVLACMGRDGWELVSTADDGYTLFFKRPLRGTR